MSLGLPQIAERWEQRAEEARSLPYDQVLQRPAEWAVYVHASLRATGSNPTREALGESLANLEGAQVAIRALLSRTPQPDPVIKGPPLKRGG
jgi:hypothetical protein